MVLTKLDGDARGGAALSVRYVTGQPIMFASNGEKLEDFDVFHPDRMASRILGMGDMLTLIEQAQKTFDADEAERMASKLTSGNEFTLEDFLEQLQAIRRMGPIGNLLGMLPGAGQMKEALAQVDDKDLDRTAAIIRSMTPAERADPKMINGSRRLRIANGSGVTVSEVNNLVDRFFEARKMMARMMAAWADPGRAATRRNSQGQRRTRRARTSRPARRPRTSPDAGRRLPGGMPGGVRRGSCPVASGKPGGFSAAARHRAARFSKLKFPRAESPPWPRSSTDAAMRPGSPMAAVAPARRLPARGAERDAWIVDGRLTFEPVAGAETIGTGGWVLPGFVDAHCHIGVKPDGWAD